MKVIRVFGNIIFMAAAIFFCLCMSIRPLCASTVSGAVLGREVSSRVLDEVYKVYPEVTSEQMEEVENFLEENQAVKELAGAYLDVMAGSVKDGTPVSPEDYEALIGELKQDVFPQLMDEMGDLLTEEEKNALYEGIDSQSEKIGQIMAQGAAEITEQSYPPVETALELYGFLDSFSVKALSLGVVILSGIIVLASGRRRYRGLLSLARDGIVSGIMVGAVIPFLANTAAHVLTNRILGRTAELTLTPLFFYGGIFFAGGFVLLIMYYVVRGRRR